VIKLIQNSSCGQNAGVAGDICAIFIYLFITESYRKYTKTV